MESRTDVDHTIRNEPDGEPSRRYVASPVDLRPCRSRHSEASRGVTAHRLKSRVPAGQVSWRQLYETDHNRNRSVAARDSWRGTVRSYRRVSSEVHRREPVR